MKTAAQKGKQGFTLVEILVVVAILGVIMAAVYSVYLTHQKSAYTQQDVVDVQQNLRIAMDGISKDLRMAGMLIPSTLTPVAAGSGAASVTIYTASAKGIYAQVTAATAVGNACPVGSSEDVDIFNANQVNPFTTNANPVRIIQPIDGSEPFGTNTTFTVNGWNNTTPSLTLQGPAGTIPNGAVIVMTDAGAPDPDTVKYSLVGGGTGVNGVNCPQNQSCIVRTANCTAADTDCYKNGTANIVANNISAIQFSYIFNDSSESATPDTVNTNSNQYIGNIRAIRVTITGQTSSTALLSGGPKTRQLQSVVRIRR